VSPAAWWCVAGGALSVLVGGGAVLMLRSAAAIRTLKVALAASEEAPSIDARAGAPPPTLSVVVTARDEERDVEDCVERFLAQDYPGMELIVVDDRSTDRTPAILDALSLRPSAAGRLVVVHSRELPEGRLGKCHACSLGAARGRGAWILFADGDVSLRSPDLLKRVVAMAERERFDHVAILPDLRPQTVLQEAIVNVFGTLYLQACRAWEIERDLPRGGGGVGAFNLVRRTAYDRVGGHSLLMMDTADDFKLGRILKETGARQRMFHGTDLVVCPWLRGLPAVVRGIEKNSFGGFNYSLSFLAAASLAIAVAYLGPVFLPILGARFGAFDAPLSTIAVLLPAALQYGAIAFQLLRYGDRTGSRVLPSILYPLGVVFFLYAIWRSAILTLARGGVLWRDTFYPLDALKAGLVREGAGRRAAGR
jgi:cellulose synthase/poly-beta-1,6-N-acetylglucosamine synthase-like glycosyltransferase